MTNEALPDPIVPAEVDLRDFSFTPMFRSRLFGSSFHAQVSDSGWRAGVTLWLKSWDQMPAGTLPTGEVDLCRLAEFGRDLRSWRKVAQEALWGWIKCSDGRMHHQTVAQGVIEAWHKKLAQRARTEAARASAIAKRLERENEALRLASVTDPVTEHRKDEKPKSVTGSVTETKGQGQYKGQGEGYSDSDLDPTNTDPLPVQGERAVGKSVRRKRNDYPPKFLTLWEAYPRTPIMGKLEAYEVWAKLPEEEQDAAMAAIPAYKSYLKSNPNTSVIHLCRFLSKQRAEGLLESANRVAAGASVFVKQDTPQWEAWRDHYQHTKGKNPPVNNGGWYFESEWPPGHMDEMIGEALH